MKYKDFTIKAKLKNFESVENKLVTMNSQFIRLDKQVDHYFATSKGKLKLRQGTIENLITHYERIVECDIERTIVYRYDMDPTEEQIDELRISSKPLGTISKERKIYNVENIKIHLDKLSDGQCFIEIEAIDRANIFTDDELKTQCLNMKSTLNINDTDLVRTGYLTV